MADTLPGGGRVDLPRPYTAHPSYPTNADRAEDVLVGYRNWRSTMSGYPECDGMIAAARSDRFPTLDAFVRHAWSALSIHWGASRTIPGQRWDGNERSYPLEPGQGPDGPEITGQLSVQRVGWLRPYDKPAAMLAVALPPGVLVGVWIYQSDGGLRRARALAAGIARSFVA
jgi:hypothetical protein